MPEVRNPLWNFEAFNFRSRIWFERKPLARNLKGVFPRNIQFYACIIQLSLCIQPDLCNIEVRLVQYTYMFNGTCSKCAQLIEILRSASETQRKRSFRRKGSLGITSLPFEMILHQHAFVRICWACIILLSLLSIDISMDLPIPTYLLTSTYIYSPSTDISLHLPTPAYIYLHLPTSTYIYRHLPTSTYIYLHLPTSTDIYRHLPTSTYIYLHLPTSTDIYRHLPIYLPTYIYRHLPTSTYIYRHLPTSTYIYLHLPTSTDIYRHLPTSTYIYRHLPTSTYIYRHLPTSTYIYLHLPTSTDIYLHLPTSTYIYLHLPTSTDIYLHLPTSTYIYRHLPTSTYIYRHLPTSTYIYLHLPTSTYIYRHLPTSTDIYRHLPTSTYIYLHLPTSTYLPIGGIVSQWFVSWVGGWHCETSNLHIYGIPGVGSERWNLFAWAALNGDAPLEVLVVTMDCPTKTCPSQLSVQIISAPACDSTNLSPSNLRSIAQLSISSFCSFSICSSSWGWSFGSGQLASVSCRDCGKKQLGAPKIPSPDGNSRCWGNMALLVLITEAAIQRYTMSEAIDTISSSTQ